jgi:hypothetical protein
MMTNFNLEIFSPAMKAKLDMKYRRRQYVEHQLEAVESWNGIGGNNGRTALPFTTKTRAYGTYHGRNQRTEAFSW